jgi:hypothetical protein
MVKLLVSIFATMVLMLSGGSRKRMYMAKTPLVFEIVDMIWCFFERDLANAIHTLPS